MSWIGKLAGGSIGFAVGGPIGAVLGVLAGHSLFDGNYGKPGRGSPALSAEQKQAAYFVGTFSMLAKLVRSDGRVTQSEINAIEEVMRDRLRLAPDARRLAIKIFNAAKESRDSFEDFAIQFYGNFYDSGEILYLQLQLLLTVALADGGLHREEKRLLRFAASTYLLDEEFAELLRRVEAVLPARSSDISNAYRILGCVKGDSLLKVKKSYRRLAMEHHPDRVLAKGMPEELVAVAEDRFKEIQEAYEVVVADIKGAGA